MNQFIKLFFIIWFCLLPKIQIKAQVPHWHKYAIMDSAQTSMNTPVVIHVSNNDSLIPEPMGYPYLASPFVCDYPFFQGVLSSVNGGTLSILNNSITYTPPFNFTGKDSFRYGICNNGGNYTFDTTLVIIRVQAVVTGFFPFESSVKINLFPNPTDENVTITSTTDFEKVEVMTLTGQILISETVNSKTHALNLENISNGVYFVKIYNSNKQVIVRKLVMQR